MLGTSLTLYPGEGACVSVAANPPEHLTAITVHVPTAWEAASIAAAVHRLLVRQRSTSFRTGLALLTLRFPAKMGA